jgi:hypothetical protein
VGRLFCIDHFFEPPIMVPLTSKLG